MSTLGSVSTRTLVQRLARVISSPWVSITLLVIVFIHQAVGSAFYPIRQSYELNEMEWFNGTASAVLWFTICVCLITASIVRVPWTLRKIGTHVTHLGVVLVVITCWIYFGNKQEGDALLVRHYVKIESTDGGACRLLPNPGFTGVLGAGTATIRSIVPRWSILSPQGKSELAWAVMVDVELPNAPPFTATLIENRPDLTQYTLTGPRTESFLAEYSNVVFAHGNLHVTTAEGKAVLVTAVKKGAKTIEVIADGERSLEITDLNDAQIGWTLKTPAGQQSGSSPTDQTGITQFFRARLKNAPDVRLKAIALEDAPERLAYHKDRSALWVRRADDARVGDPLQPMRPMDAKSVTALPIQGLPRYHEYGSDFPGAKALNLPLGSVDAVAFSVTGFAPYARQRTRWTDAEAQQSRLVFVTSPVIDDPGYQVLLLVSTPGSQVRRYPISSGSKTTINLLGDKLRITLRQILTTTSATPGSEAGAGLPDPRLDVELISVADGKAFNRQLPPSTVSAVDHLPMLWIHCSDHAALDELETKLAARFADPTKPSPVIVPVENRQSRMSVGDYESMIQVTATGAHGLTTAWVPYTPYPHLPSSLKDLRLPLEQSDDWTTLERHAPNPVYIDVPGAGRFELNFGKEALPMPGAIWMTGFDVPRRPGNNSPSEFFCQVGYGDRSAPQTGVIHMNHPLAWMDTFFFQAGWDPKLQALTVLGVGNRPAGMAMLWASIVLALGMAISGTIAALPRSKP